MKSVSLIGTFACFLVFCSMVFTQSVREALSNQSPVSARPVAERTMLQICLNSLRSC